MPDYTNDEIPVYYANTVQLKTSFFDLQLHLGVQTGPPSDECPTSAIVVLSLEQARALAGGMQQVIMEYEANCGPVRAVKQAPEVRRWEER